MKKFHFLQFFVDPQSGQASASRFCLMVMVLVYMPALFVLEALGIKVTYWTQFAAIVGSITGCYAANSTARIWKSGYQEEFQSGQVKPPPKPPTPGE